MTQILDISKPAKEILIDKFNAKAGLQLSYDHVTLGAITVIEPPEDGCDTEVEFLPTVTGNFLNKFKLRYSRMSLEDVFATPLLKIEYKALDTLYECLDDINTKLGVNITVDDVLPANVISQIVDSKTIRTLVVKTKPTSYFFKGEVTFTFDHENPNNLGKPDSNSIIYAVVKDTAIDTVVGMSFDGYKANIFKFLENIDLINTCKIDNIHTTESELLVLNGTFSFVAANLWFIDPLKTYHTITVSKSGVLVSAREEISPLGQVPAIDVIVDPAKRCYYIIDKANVVGSNPKRFYKLFENGTLDNSFSSAQLPDSITNVIMSKFGMYVIEDKLDKLIVSRYTDTGLLDNSFTTVEILKDPAVNVTVNGFALYEEAISQESLTLYLVKDTNLVSNRLLYIAETVNEFEGAPTDFFSPIITIREEGKVVDASSVASTDNIPTFLDTDTYQVIFKNLFGKGVIYSLKQPAIVNNVTIAPLLVDEFNGFDLPYSDREFDKNFTSIVKVKQISSATETYVLAEFISSGIDYLGLFSFDAKHAKNGPIKILRKTVGTISDFAIIRR